MRGPAMRLTKRNAMWISALSAALLIAGCPQAIQPEDSEQQASAASAQSATSVGDDCCVDADPGSPRTGCNAPEIEACVCSALPECCTVNWGLACVGEAFNVCGGCAGLSDEQRAIVALLGDSDGDGLLDYEEINAGLDPFNPFDGPDVDGDGIANGEDPDVDGDGTLNAYDRDVDGDGLLNVVDDDIDGDGLPNALVDLDDDGDGIPNFIDNDDNADGLPDRDYYPPENCKANLDCPGAKVCAAGECMQADKAASHGPVNQTKCSADADCKDDEVCLVVKSNGMSGSQQARQIVTGDNGHSNSRPVKECVKVDPECGPSDDEDGDGVCDKLDPDPDGDGDTDDDDDGLSDRDERALGTNQDDWDSDDDSTRDGDDTDPFDDEVGAENGFDDHADENGIVDGEEEHENGIEAGEEEHENGIENGEEPDENGVE